MAYARWGDDSDVYVFPDMLTNGYCCMGCTLTGSLPSSDELQGFGATEFRLDTPEEMLQHLLEHREAGDKVPDYAINRLKKEIADG
jgi:hypothetical protein